MAHPLDYLFSESGAVEDENDGVIPSEDELPEGDGEADNDDEAGGPSKPVQVEVKKKTTKHPRNMLNEAKLCGPRGIIALKDHFKDFKFHGKGHEASDLNRLMRHYEHWAHRLYPKFHFDDCMAKIEKLGHKKQVQMYMNKYRTGLLQQELDEAAAVHSEDELDDNQMNQPLDPLDSMLEEQIARSRGRTSVGNTSGIDNILEDTRFDALRQDKVNYQPTDNGDIHANALKDTQQTAKSPSINDEIRAKIEANRLRALELRKARMLSQSQNTNEMENTENETSSLAPE